MPQDFDLNGTIRELRILDKARSVLLRRTYPATVEQLWTTCTDPDTLSRWIGAVTGDPATGIYELTATGGLVATCEVLRCDAPDRLEILWTVAGEASVVRASVADVPEGAELTIEHLALTSTEGLEYGHGWEVTLDELNRFVTGQEKIADDEVLRTAVGVAWQSVETRVDDRFGSIDGTGNYRKSVSFPAGIDRVWDAVATVGGLSAWFGRTSGDLRTGGEWRVEFDEGTVSGVIAGCEPSASFATTFVQGIDDPATSTHEVSVELAAEEGGTRLTLTHTFAAATEPAVRTGMAAGWHAYLDALAQALDPQSGKGSDWLSDFRSGTAVLQKSQ